MSAALSVALWLGRVPAPAPADLLGALESADVVAAEQGRSGFQLVFRSTGAAGSALGEHAALRSGLLDPGGRVVIGVVMSGQPTLLLDGVITHLELSYASERGEATLAATGEDLCALMDAEERIVEHPGLDEAGIAAALLSRYASLGVVPRVSAPPVSEAPDPHDRTPLQRGTDLETLTELAGRFGYQFYLSPGPLPGQSVAWWGPPVRTGAPQRALNVGLGPLSTVTRIHFQHEALLAPRVRGMLQDRVSGQSSSFEAADSSTPPLGRQGAGGLAGDLRPTRWLTLPGLTGAAAQARAQGAADAESEPLTATGTLDGLRYGAPLLARGLVDLRGAGDRYSGTWAVTRVRHELRPGAWQQHFTLSRGGIGAASARVVP